MQKVYLSKNRNGYNGFFTGGFMAYPLRPDQAELGEDGLKRLATRLNFKLIPRQGAPALKTTDKLVELAKGEIVYIVELPDGTRHHFPKSLYKATYNAACTFIRCHGGQGKVYRDGRLVKDYYTR